MRKGVLAKWTGPLVNLILHPETIYINPIIGFGRPAKLSRERLGFIEIFWIVKRWYLNCGDGASIWYMSNFDINNWFVIVADDPLLQGENS